MSSLDINVVQGSAGSGLFAGGASGVTVGAKIKDRIRIKTRNGIRTRIGNLQDFQKGE
ncbi:hypothetical protein BGX21_007880, partial [Mortierella sp. AD011]